MNDVVFVSYRTVCEYFIAYNRAHPDDVDKPKVSAVIVYSESNWDKPYSLESRSYQIFNNCPAFVDNKISNRVSGYCLDGSDQGVRLDWYNWKIDYCYLE